MTHPIIPPPELVREWQKEANHNEAMFPQVAAMAAQWGADQELEACIAWFDTYIPGYELVAVRLRAARRPKPPSLKEQALDVLHLSFDRGYLKEEAADTIRRALEALPE